MALPTIIGNLEVAFECNVGPYRSPEGAFYTFTHGGTAGDSVGEITPWKCTDPSTASSWVAQTQKLMTRATTEACGSTFTRQVGDKIHVIVQDRSVTTTFFGLRYNRYDTVSDAWDVTTSTLIHSRAGANSGTSSNGGDFAIRNDGDIVVIYIGDTANVMGQRRDRIEFAVSTDAGATWNEGTTLVVTNSGIDEASYVSPSICIDEDDVAHMLFTNSLNADPEDDGTLWWRGVDGDHDGSTGTLYPTSSMTDTASDVAQGGKALASSISVLRSGVNVLRALFIDRTPQDLKILEWNKSTAPTFSEQTIDSAQSTNTSRLHMTASSDGILYAVYSDTTGDDIWTANDGGTDTWVKVGSPLISETALDGVSCNIIEASDIAATARVDNAVGRVLAFVYQNGSNDVKYSEESHDATSTALSEVDFPTQNYFVGPFEITNKYGVFLIDDRSQIIMSKATTATPVDGDWNSIDSAINIFTSSTHNGTYMGFVDPIISLWAVEGPTLVIDQSVGSASGPWGGDLGGFEKIAQSFTAFAGRVSGVRMICVADVGSPTDAVKVSIQADASGDPSGTDLTSSTIQEADLPQVDEDDVFFVFDDKITLLTGNTYWIVMERTGALDSSNRYTWGGHTVSAYAGGTNKTLTSGTWSDQTRDLRFTVFREDIHVASQQTSGRVAHHAFDTDADAWSVRDEQVAIEGDTNFDTRPAQPAVALAVRSNGDVVIVAAYADVTPDQRLRCFTRAHATGTWTNEGAADGAVAATDYSGVSMMGPDGSDRISWVFLDNDNGDVDLKSIDVADVFNGPTEVSATADTATLLVGPGVIDSANKIYVAYVFSDNQVSTASWTSGTGPTVTEDDTMGLAVVAFNGAVAAPFPTLCLAVDGTDVHLLYSDSTFDLQHNDDVDGGGAVSETEEVTGTVNRVSANKGTSDLNYFYELVAVTTFGSISLAGPPTLAQPIKKYPMRHMLIR